MSDIHEKGSGYAGSSTDDSGSATAAEVFERPTGLRGVYYHPVTQIVLLGLVCFMCPGLFNALNGLGGGGRLTADTTANANSILYATFAFFSFFSGSINNKLGSRLTLQLGTAGYVLYIGSILSLFLHPNETAFVLTAGGILGVCAALLWTAQGSLMLAYPTEQQKGKFIGLFWAIFNLGAVIGAAVPLAQTFGSKGNAVGKGTYIAFLILTSTGVFLPMLMADPAKMVRTDGTKVTLPRHPSWWTEFYSLWVALRTDPWIVLLFPMFFASNWFYPWQFDDYNGALFNIRGRSLNNFVYWLAQILGSIAIGLLLDQHRLSRRLRAFTGWAVLLVLVFVVHIWGYFYQRDYTRESTPATATKMDINDKGYAAHVWLYIFCGILDSAWQTAAYWMMGAMSNDPAKLAYFTGFYKSLQSAGAAGVWRADGVLLPYMNMFVSTWTLLVAGLVFMFPMIYMRVKDTTPLADETIARMDNSGQVQSVEVVKAEIAAARHDVVAA